MGVDHDRGILAYGIDEGDHCTVGHGYGHEEARYPGSRQLYASVGAGERVPKLELCMSPLAGVYQ